MIDYTQHTVAWPQLPISPAEVWHTDELMIGYDDDSEKSGEFGITFMRFANGSTGVELHVFGDGLDLFYEERIQRVIAAWQAADRDEATPAAFIGWLEAEGAKPSEYHAAGLARSPEETARLAAMRRKA